MLYIRTATYTYVTLHTNDISIGINLCPEVATCSIAEVGLVGVHKVPVRSREVVTFEFQCRLTKHHSYRVLTEGLVIGKGVLHLPCSIIALIYRG